MLFLTGCLINTELYERRKAELADLDGDGYTMEDECDDADASVHPGVLEICDGVDQDCDGVVDEGATDMATWFEDADGDGHGDSESDTSGCDAPAGFVAVDDDCDDDNAQAYPDAADAWYDGVDANCDGADDYDADGDGDPAQEWGGTDCDDEDASVSGMAAEGWTDAGVDNNCDGSIEDQARVEVGDLGVRIDGADEGGAFGTTLLTLPAGWADEEAVLLAAAPFQGSGDVYGWRASELGGAALVSSATWHVTGDAEGDFLGYGLGWGGDASSPLVAIGSEGARGALGVVDVFGSLEEDPVVTIVGDVPSAYFGAQIVPGYDHDGDGVSDLVAAAPFDSRVAVNGGAVYVFHSVGGLTGEVSTADADVVFTTTYAGARLSVSDVGDVDGDGVGDLGLGLLVAYEDGPGGLLVSGASSVGSVDAQGASFAQLWAAGNAFSTVFDSNADGVGELIVASGGLERYELPLSGTVTPWDNGDAAMAFSDATDTVTGVYTDLAGYGGHSSFLLASSSFAGARGGLFVHQPRWLEGMAAEDARFALVGDLAGDAFATAFDVYDLDDDGVEDLIVGAPDTDAGGAGSGAVYVAPGPR